MKTSSANLWGGYLCQCMSASGMLIMLSGCDKLASTPEANGGRRASPVASAHDESVTESATANVLATQPFDIAAQVGAPFDELRFEREFGKPLPVPLSTLGGDPNIRIVSFHAGTRGPNRVITVSSKNNTVAAIELTFDASETGGAKLKEDLLKGYVHSKSHSVTMLSPTLEESVHMFEELDRPSTCARVLTLLQGRAARIILFDEGMVTADQILPSTKHLPPGLLEKARSMAEKQKLLLETIK